MATTKTTGNYTVLTIEAITPNPAQPRKHFDQAALQTLADSISANGLLQPITVTHRGGGRYQIIAGERRWRAAQLAGLAEIPAIVRARMSDTEVYTLSVLENMARADMTVIEEATAYAQLRDMGSTIPEVARITGSDEKLVRQRLSLLNLRPAYQALAANGQLPRVRAYLISRLNPDAQDIVMDKLVAGDIITEQQVKHLCDALLARQSQPALISQTEQDKRYEAGSMQRKIAQTSWDKIEALGPAMADFLEMDASDLATALGPDIDIYRDRIATLAKTAAAMQTKLDQAQAMRDAQLSY